MKRVYVVYLIMNDILSKYLQKLYLWLTRFTWGESEAELIKHRYSEYEDKIKVTGNPRMDMLLEPNKLFHQDLADKYKSEFGPYFLFLLVSRSIMQWEMKTWIIF